MDYQELGGQHVTEDEEEEEEGEEEEEEEEEGEEEEERPLLVVDRFPPPSLRNKTVTRITTRLFRLLHDLNWATFDAYTLTLARQYPNDPNVKMVCSIYRVDSLRYNKNDSQVARTIADIEDLETQASCESLLVRYKTTKSTSLFFQGQQNQALALQSEAIQMGELQSPNNSTAYNLMIYGLHNWMHRVNSRGYNVIPDEGDWEKAQECLRTAYEHHCIWTEDLGDFTYIPARVGASFRNYAFVRYIYSLVHSCVGGGFVYFSEHRCPHEDVVEAKKCIAHLAPQQRMLGPKMKVEFTLVQCDCALRESEWVTGDDRRHLIEEAREFATEALFLITELGDVKYAKSYRMYVRIRLDYIKRSVRGEAPGPVSPRDVQLSYTSHMLPFKKPSLAESPLVAPSRCLYADNPGQYIPYVRTIETSKNERSVRRRCPRISKVTVAPHGTHDQDARKQDHLVLNLEPVNNTQSIATEASTQTWERYFRFFVFSLFIGLFCCVCWLFL